MLYSVVFFFFFKQKTAYEMRISDWSSDVCSSDLVSGRPVPVTMIGAPCAAALAGKTNDSSPAKAARRKDRVAVSVKSWSPLEPGNAFTAGNGGAGGIRTKTTNT